MSQAKSSFHPMFTSFAMYAADEDLREVKTGEIFSIAHMSEREVREAIVQDILVATLWEIEKQESINFNAEEFLRFVPNTGDRQKVLLQMLNAEIAGLIEGMSDKEDQLRIKKDRASMQAAMDYCGVWAEGYDMPEGVLVTNYNAVEEALEVHGSIENLTSSFAIDLASTVQGNQTRH